MSDLKARARWWTTCAAWALLRLVPEDENREPDLLERTIALQRAQIDELRTALRLAVTWLPIETMVRDPDWREQLHTIRAALLLGRDRTPAPPEGPAT